ncbi:GNAT family N-acetyltransferase [Gorillibacterium timonense]|uniref:GNAT family N-acetyltransferase n=1 Tax=Gorillibacterium timonense TaxID=1689269 RepID=UPI00071C3AE8|nr:GNAT family N-acetyltransferase [Gorillibacterium timonense]
MIRKRTAEDDRQILRLVEQELMPLARQAFPNLKVTLKELRERMKRGSVYVMEEETKGKRKVIGFVIAVNASQDLWIDMLAVGKDHQGKGLGAELLKKAEDVGRRKGCDHAQLFVDRVNRRAQLFYAKKGYMMTRYIQEVNCYQMTRELTAARSASHLSV